LNQHFFAPCPRGLEDALTEELRELECNVTWQTPGGVGFEDSLGKAYRVNLESRIASRVLMRVRKARYRSVDDVYKLALDVPWWNWTDADQTLRIDLTASKSPLTSLDFATLRVKDGICDAFRHKVGKRPSIDTASPDVRVFVFLDAEQCTLYLDLSGEPLFRRGWRGETVEAPLRENLAAGILRLIGWRPGQALLDPMCGSGTFIIEAAQMTLGMAPGQFRRFAFEKLKNFDAAAWKSQLARPRPAPGGLELLRASDVSGDAVTITRGNLVRAGISEELAALIAAKQIDARHIKPQAEEGILIANPPYGERIAVRGDADDEAFFAAFGDNLKARFSNWRCAVLTSDMALQRKIHLAPKRRTPLFNGKIECRLYLFEMVRGSARRERPAASNSEAADET
jgi:putative N6-adenine-specific DNA methylase